MNTSVYTSVSGQSGADFTPAQRQPPACRKKMTVATFPRWQGLDDAANR